jgi:hypothetical protein
MKSPIFDAMQDWVVDVRVIGSALFGNFMEEAEHYMGLRLLERQAKRDLHTIVQKPDEGISEYYHRIRPLWKRAKTSEPDCIDQFMTTMIPRLSRSLLVRSYDNVRDLLDNARTIEDRQKDIDYHLRRRRVGVTSTTHTNLSLVTRSPVAEKPNSWSGQWYEPNLNPKKMDTREKALMIWLGCCWSCRV